MHIFGMGMGLTFLPIVCFGPSLILNLPVPSANVNCGVTYTGKATILLKRIHGWKLTDEGS